MFLFHIESLYEYSYFLCSVPFLTFFLVRAARQAKGIYLRDSAKMCNLPFEAISEIETGKRNSYILTLKHIADN